MKAGRAPGTAALVAAALLAAAGMAGAVGRSAFLGDYLRQSRIVYPQQVGEWASRGEHRYETAALGVSVRYENPRLPGARLDLYAFPGGALLEPAFAEAVTRTVQELETVARTRDPDLFEPGDMRAFAVDDPVAAYLGEHTPRPRSYALQAGVDGHVEQSAMAIALREMYFVKVRLSLPGDASRREQVRTLAEDFLRAALVRLRIVNTGACFHPLQVVALPVDRVRPDDILASAGEGTPQEVWVGDARIHVTEQALADPQALAAATAFGQALHDALRGRCIAPEDMDIAVPEGMREIRMEYRPAGSGDLARAAAGPGDQRAL